MAALRICSIPTCSKTARTHGWCNAHWLRWRKHGDPLGGGPDRRARPSICNVDGCEKPRVGRGWCDKHWHRWRVHGDPLGGGTPFGEPQRYLNDVVLTYEGNECLRWPFGGSDKGYGKIHFNGQYFFVSRLVCAHVHGPAPTAEHQARHLCGKGHEGCVTPRHLVWGTRVENKEDEIEHGTRVRGVKSIHAKLTESDVRQIRALRGTMLNREIAALFGVRQNTVSQIGNKRSWAWLED